MGDCGSSHPYDTLGVDKKADLATIRCAHRKLVLQCHPDRNPSEEATQTFAAVQQAYELLSNDKKRERYDNQVKFAESRQEVKKANGAHHESRRTWPKYDSGKQPGAYDYSMSTYLDDLHSRVRWVTWDDHYLMQEANIFGAEIARFYDDSQSIRVYGNGKNEPYNYRLNPQRQAEDDWPKE